MAKGGGREMIIFEFETDNGQERDIYWLGSTAVTGEDEQHCDEIYEQIMAHESYLDEAI